MPWKKVNLREWAREAGVDLREIDQKLKLREKIVKLRLARGLTQTQLAQLTGVSRSRIAQIENGVKLQRMSFDILLRILLRLGHDYQITTRRHAA